MMLLRSCLRRSATVLAGLVVCIALFIAVSACDGGAERDAGVSTVGREDAGTPVGERLAVAEPVVACASLEAFDLTAIGGDGSRVESAALGTHEDVPVCEIDGILAPEIGFKLVLPMETWTQRYLQVGCGGLCGRISLNAGAADGCMPLETGQFAVASTDMGHEGPSGDFGRDPQKRIDYAYRGVHLTAVAAKALIAEFYGRPAAYSYFSGCSDGGREALMEAQRFPDDFDGIVAGAPAMNVQVQNSFYHAWQALSNTGDDGAPILVADRLAILHDAAVAACDEIDGLKDGLITDPRSCEFDPVSVECPDGRAAGGCLSAAEAEAARRLYAGPRDAETGLPLTLGGPQPGSELTWAGVFVPRQREDRIFSATIALDALRNVIFEENPPDDYALDDLGFDSETFDAVKALHGLYAATDPDLGEFASAGGKLILWHGWSDPHISPINTIAYYEAVEALLGADRTTSMVRLFLFPGVGHCRGGDGPDRFDLLTPVMEWVENGQAPDAVIASQEREAAPERSRPVFPYPDVAVFRGQGSPDQASSFIAGEGAPGPASYDWMGRDLFAPGHRLDCTAENGELVCKPAATRRQVR